MRRMTLTLLIVVLFTCPLFETRGNQPDSAYLVAYATLKNDGRNGLHFAWSLDLTQWHAIGPERSFLKCDYGRWGMSFRM